jgi:hypothetical protein
MMRSLSTAILAGVIATAPATSLAQAPSPMLSGNFTLTATMTIPESVGPCVFQGVVMLVQEGPDVMAPVALGLLSGPESCPGELIGDLTGGVEQGDLDTIFIGGLISGTDPGGAASFSGTFVPEPIGVSTAGFGGSAQEPSTGGGDLNVTQGPFAGVTGTWSAVQASAVPAITPLGLLLLVGLVAALGAYLLRRQPRVAQP